MSSLVAPGLTSPRALRSRVLQALSTSEDVHRVLLESIAQARSPLSTSSSLPNTFWLYRGYEVLKPRIFSSDMLRDVLALHME